MRGRFAGKQHHQGSCIPHLAFSGLPGLPPPRSPSSHRLRLLFLSQPLECAAPSCTRGAPARASRVFSSPPLLQPPTRAFVLPPRVRRPRAPSSSSFCALPPHSAAHPAHPRMNAREEANAASPLSRFVPSGARRPRGAVSPRARVSACDEREHTRIRRRQRPWPAAGRDATHGRPRGSRPCRATSGGSAGIGVGAVALGHRDRGRGARGIGLRDRVPRCVADGGGARRSTGR